MTISLAFGVRLPLNQLPKSVGHSIGNLWSVTLINLIYHPQRKGSIYGGSLAFRGPSL
jgi:hypothetical protein